MVANAKPMFRPSLVICVGKVGEQIREHLTPFPGKAERMADGPRSVYNLLASIDPALRQMIGILQVVTDGPNADFDRAVPVPVDRTFPNDPVVPTAPGELKATIRAALISVQLDRRIMDIRTQGYNVPNPRTQVFIVGEGKDDEKDMYVMAKILGIVRELSEEFHFETPVFYFLNSNLTGNHHSTLLKPKPANPSGLKWNRYHLANFSYLHEAIIPFPAPAFVTPEERQYATAEALLAFIATGVTTLPLMEPEIHLSLDLQDYSSHVGSVSTSMIYFPHAAVLSYCSNLLSGDLMLAWRTSYENSSVSAPERKRLRDQARQQAADVLLWMRDSQPRNAAEELSGPSLAILRGERQPRQGQRQQRSSNVIERLDILTGALFRWFSEDVVAEAFKDQKARSWSELAMDRNAKATGYFLDWERQARQAWDAAERLLDDSIRRDVDELWEKSDEGFERAKVFVDEFDERLTDVLDDTTHRRQDHIVVYQEDRDGFQERARGEWDLAEDETSILGAGLFNTQQLGPRILNQQQDTDVLLGTTTTIIGMGGGNSSGPGGGGLPDLEEGIAASMGNRVTYKQRLVPPLGTLVSTSLLGSFTLFEALKALPLDTTWPLPVNIGAVALVGALSAGLYWLRSRDLHKARRDMLAFYRRYYAYQCECREDLQRIKLIRFIKGRVLQRRLRLDNLSTLFANIENNSRKEAAQVVEQLFDGPGGQRDILIANGERLQRNGRHTLESINKQISHSRQNRPLQDWHHSLDAMKSQLMVELRAGPRSLLEMSEDEVQAHLSRFMTQIVDGYLTGALVNISATLDKPEIWREIIERVSKPMYFASVGMRDPQLLFVCGSNADLVRSSSYIPTSAIQVTTRSSEWLLVAAFFRGGEPTKLNADVLFPAK